MWLAGNEVLQPLLCTGDDGKGIGRIEGMRRPGTHGGPRQRSGHNKCRSQQPDRADGVERYRNLLSLAVPHHAGQKSRQTVTTGLNTASLGGWL